MVEDTPDDLVFELHNAQLWGAHPYGYSILGTRETVGALDVRRPAGAARARVPPRPHRRRRGRRRRPRRPRRRARAQPAGATRARATPRRCRRRAAPRRRPRTSTCARPDADADARGVRRPDAARTATPRATRSPLVSMVLGGGMSSRLFQKVREELGLAYAVHTFQIVPRGRRHARRLPRDRAGDRAARRSTRCARARAPRAARGCPTTSSRRPSASCAGRSRCRSTASRTRMYRAAGRVALRRAVPPARRGARARRGVDGRRRAGRVRASSSTPTRQTC